MIPYACAMQRKKLLLSVVSFMGAAEAFTAKEKKEEKKPQHDHTYNYRNKKAFDVA